MSRKRKIVQNVKYLEPNVNFNTIWSSLPKKLHILVIKKMKSKNKMNSDFRNNKIISQKKIIISKEHKVQNVGKNQVIKKTTQKPHSLVKGKKMWINRKK